MKNEAELDGIDWVALDAAGFETVVEARFGKKDVAAAREEEAAESRVFAHRHEHLHGIVVVKVEEASESAAKGGLSAMFTRFGRAQSGGNADPLDIRFIMLDGQALHLYPLVLRHDSDKPAGVLKKLANMQIGNDDTTDSASPILLDKKRQVKRLSMVGAIVSSDPKVLSVSLSFGDNIARLLFRPPLLKSAKELNVWVQKLEAAAQSSFRQDYRVVKRLGEGAYAKVFRCEDRKTKQGFAVKVLDFDRGDENSRIYMRREFAILAVLDQHPNVVGVRDVYEEPDRMYFVMDMLACDLFAYMDQKGKLDEKKARVVMHQVLSGISFMHSAGVTHRDIKPKNIVLNSLADVRITDFGSARLQESASIGMSTGLKKSVAGSGGFIAPEIIALKPYGRKVDMWSAGVLLYYMLSHDLPFNGATEVLTYAAITRGVFKMDGPKWDIISDDAKDIIRSLIVLDQDKRPRAHEVLNHKWFAPDPTHT